jgi:hypothetical protein
MSIKKTYRHYEQYSNLEAVSITSLAEHLFYKIIHNTQYAKYGFKQDNGGRVFVFQVPSRNRSVLTEAIGTALSWG